MSCICTTIWRRPPCCDSVVQPWAVLITLYLFNNLTWLFDTCTKLTHAHTCVYCLMSSIKFLQDTLAPCQWNGPIVDNSACNDFQFVWREQAGVFPSLHSFKQSSYWFLHSLCDFILHRSHTNTQGEEGDGSKVKGPPGPQGDRVSTCMFFLFLVFLKTDNLVCLINFHMNSGSSRSPRTKGRARWSWTHCKSNNQLLLTPWLMFHSLSCRIYFFRDSRVLMETEVKQVPLGFL